MIAQVRRDVSDPQSALRGSVVGVRTDLRFERVGVLPVPSAVLFRDRRRAAGRVEEKCEDQIAVNLHVAGVDRDAADVAFAWPQAPVSLKNMQVWANAEGRTQTTLTSAAVPTVPS